jgi:long-chain fatty acid transport protein
MLVGTHFIDKRLLFLLNENREEGRSDSMKKSALWAMILVGLPSIVLAGGWNNSLLGARTVVLGGCIALGDDPGAIFYNPGGIVDQENPLNLAIDAFRIAPTHQVTLPTGSTIESKYNSTVPQFFLTGRVLDRLTVGLGVFVPYAGGGVDWKAADLGFPLKTTLGVFSITPTVAYRVSDRLSVGMTLNIYSGRFTLDTDQAPLGSLSSNESGSALTAGLGLLYRPSSKLRIGLSVRGAATVTMSGTTKVNLGGYNVFLASDTTIKLPWDLQAGLAFQASGRLLLTLNAQYTLWSTLDKVEKVIKNIPTLGDLNFEQLMDFRNILLIGGGVEYALSRVLFVRAGVGLDKWATPPESLAPSNIDVDKVSLMAGLGYRTGRVRVDLAYIDGIGDPRSVEMNVMGIPLTETYNLNVRVLGIGLTYGF